MQNIITIFAPEINLSQFGNVEIDNNKNRQKNNYHKTIGIYAPAVDINGNLFSHENVVDFVLTVGGFLPSINITLSDPDKKLGSYSSLTDSILKLFVRSKNPDFKPIRNDYKITSITQSQDKLNISGVLYVPELHKTKIISFPNKTSLDTLQDIAKMCQLGFACNETVTNDAMTRICPNTTFADFLLSDVIPSIYKDDNSFFYVFIDQYYYLNLVEVNQMIDVDVTYDKITIESILNIEEIQNSEPENLDVEELYLHNIKEKGHKSTFINTFDFENNIGSKMYSGGDKLYLQFWDKGNLQMQECFLTPLQTQTSDKYVDSTLESQFQNSVIIQEQNPNVHQNYLYAYCNNYINHDNLKSFKLICTLRRFVPGITCWMKLPVVIQQRDVLKFMNEQSDGNDQDIVIDQQISGNYITTQIDYEYRLGGMISSRVYLNKRDFKTQSYTNN